MQQLEKHKINKFTILISMWRKITKKKRKKAMKCLKYHECYLFGFFFFFFQFAVFGRRFSSQMNNLRAWKKALKSPSLSSFCIYVLSRLSRVIKFKLQIFYTNRIKFEKRFWMNNSLWFDSREIVLLLSDTFQWCPKFKNWNQNKISCPSVLAGPI